MIKINNFLGQNQNLKVLEQKGIFTIIEHQQDLSVLDKCLSLYKTTQLD